MAILYLDPTSNGSPFQWGGTYADIDDGLRQPTNADSTGIDSSSEGDVAVVNFNNTGNTGTASLVTIWAWADTGYGDIDLSINGSWQNQRSMATYDAATSSWIAFSYTTTADLSTATFAVKFVCGDEEDDYIDAVYLSITYTVTSSYPHGASILMTDTHSIIHPPGSGGIK
jgi:hypothetical protein